MVAISPGLVVGRKNKWTQLRHLTSLNRTPELSRSLFLLCGDIFSALDPPAYFLLKRSQGAGHATLFSQNAA